MFYLIEHSRSKSTLGVLLQKNFKSNYLYKDAQRNWKKLYNQTLKYLLEFAKKNSNIEIILKGKLVFTKKETLWDKDLTSKLHLCRRRHR